MPHKVRLGRRAPRVTYQGAIPELGAAVAKCWKPRVSLVLFRFVRTRLRLGSGAMDEG